MSRDQRSRLKAAHKRPRPMYATCDTGLEEVLAEELTAAGASNVEAGHRGVKFSGNRAVLWRANLTSRVGERILMPIAEFPAPDRDALYKGVKRIDWTAWMSPRQTLAVDASSYESKLAHTGFVAQKTKDAVCDRLRSATGSRPSVDRRRPDIGVNIHLSNDHCIVSLDSSGERLHRRGYRTRAGVAPLRETLAAGILKLSGWRGDRPLVDPMCGAGTFLVEAALIARGIAPGVLRLNRAGFGFERWADHDPEAFGKLVDGLRAEEKPAAGVPILGGDADEGVVRAAKTNAARAGVVGDVDLRVAELGALEAPDGEGFVVVNPPYGERLHVEQLPALYSQLGDTFKESFPGWEAWVLASEGAPTKRIRMKSAKRVALHNGPLPCELCRYQIRRKRR